MNFDLQDSVQILIVEYNGIGGYDWRIHPSAAWITVTPPAGSASDDSSTQFSHVVRVDKSLPPGSYNGLLRIDLKASASPKGDFDYEIPVSSLTGVLIYEFVIESNRQLDSLFTCRDSNASSGYDYWGVVQDWNSRYVWCSARSDTDGSGNVSQTYDNQMDAWMILRKPLDVSNFERLNIGFLLYCQTDTYADYLELFLIDGSGVPARAPAASSRRSGDAGYYFAYWAVSVEAFDANLSNDSLRFAFLFHSDRQGTGSGVSLSNIKIFGQPKAGG